MLGICKKGIRTLTMHNLLNSTHYLSCQTHSFSWIPYFSEWYKSPRVVITNYHKLGGLKRTKIYSLTVQDAGAPNQGTGRVGAFWRP